MMIDASNETVAWLCRLIAHKTPSSDSNLGLIDDIRCYLNGFGITTHLTFDDTGTKANMIASIYNHQKKVAGGIVLSAHTDVVPTTDQAWTKDPFTAWVADGKVFGRGACDMKGFIACCLAFIPTAVAYAKAGRLKTPLHLALSFDEEVGCLGVPTLIDDLKKHASPEYCLVGEPTGMQVVTAHKGICVYDCHIKGKAVHSSLAPYGVNAIGVAAKLIGFIDTLNDTSVRDEGFDVPFATLSVGQITGGIANNIVPHDCCFSFEHRHLPTQNPKDVFDKITIHAQQLCQRMQAIEPNTDIVLHQINAVPALTDTHNHAFAKQVQTLVGGEMSKVAYATEAGHYDRAGIPTIVCGPGSIQQAHKADEYVSVAQLAACDKLLVMLFCASDGGDR